MERETLEAESYNCLDSDLMPSIIQKWEAWESLFTLGEILLSCAQVFCISAARVFNQVLSLSHFVILNKLHHMFDPQFLHPYSGY